MATRIEKILLQKMALEEKFSPEVQEGFSEERAAYRAALKQDGISPQVALLLSIWATRVNNHTIRVGKDFITFTGVASRDAALVQTVERSMESIARFQTSLISNTSMNDMRKSTVEANKLLIEEGGVITGTALAITASNILKNFQKARDKSIEITVTQDAAEETRLQSAKSADKRKKEWFTVGDERVRPAHVQADSQQVLIDQPFTVGGELLTRPGDSSLGASAGNIINCRCISDFT